MLNPFASKGSIAELAAKVEADLAKVNAAHRRVSRAMNKPNTAADLLDTEPALKSYFSSGEQNIELHLYTDGTETEVALYAEGDDEAIGVGHARRSKGDRRNEALGIALAASRAFSEAAKLYAKVADDITTGRR